MQTQFKDNPWPRNLQPKQSKILVHLLHRCLQYSINILQFSEPLFCGMSQKFCQWISFITEEGLKRNIGYQSSLEKKKPASRVMFYCLSQKCSRLISLSSKLIQHHCFGEHKCKWGHTPILATSKWCCKSLTIWRSAVVKTIADFELLKKKKKTTQGRKVCYWYNKFKGQNHREGEQRTYKILKKHLCMFLTVKPLIPLNCTISEH